MIGAVTGAWDLPHLDPEVRVTFRYPVRFTLGALRAHNTMLRDLMAGEEPARMLAVVDEGVAAAQPNLIGDLATYCTAHARHLRLLADPLLVPGGEAVKNDSSAVQQVSAAIDAHRIDRHSYVLAVGGGAVLDAVGFAAATAHRGVRLVRVPTTVLAQADSAVGVKNGINAFGKKNFRGCFAPPYAVLNDFELLTTLSDRDWHAGVSEVVKVALVRDPELFRYLERQTEEIRRRSLPAMAWLVYRSAELHLRHIATGGDPFELGAFRPLDFGHWAAHKLEQLSRHELRYGEAVGIGLALDCTYSHLTGRLPALAWHRILDLLAALGLPLWSRHLTTPGSDGRPAVLDGIEEFREHLGGRLTLMLLERIGQGVEVHELDERVVLQAAYVLRRRGSGAPKARSAATLSVVAG